jgi:hypothetical protein
MTLDDWVLLTAEKRNQLRKDWPREGGNWLGLLEEACARFRGQFGGHPLINAIGYSKWHFATFEPSICVTTALFSPQLIEELPDRYLTFRVVQDPIEDNKQFYLRTWTLVLGELLGWSENQVRQWAREHHEDGLDGKDLFFYHEEAEKYILGLIVPLSLREQIGFRNYQLVIQRVREAIVRYGSSPLWLSPYDWGAARARINWLLGEYGASLPERKK